MARSKIRLMRKNLKQGKRENYWKKRWKNLKINRTNIRSSKKNLEEKWENL
jgi:hypothetical protein